MFEVPGEWYVVQGLASNSTIGFEDLEDIRFGDAWISPLGVAMLRMDLHRLPYVDGIPAVLNSPCDGGKMELLVSSGRK